MAGLSERELDELSLSLLEDKDEVDELELEVLFCESVSRMFSEGTSPLELVLAGDSSLSMSMDSRFVLVFFFSAFFVSFVATGGGVFAAFSRGSGPPAISMISQCSSVASFLFSITLPAKKIVVIVQAYFFRRCCRGNFIYFEFPVYMNCYA